jgi:hypothetical protein
MRSGLILALALLLCACKQDPQPAKGDMPESAIEARIERGDGGRSSLVAGKFQAVALSRDEAEGVVVSDATRVAVRSKRGGFRVFHAVGDRLVAEPDLLPDWKAASLETEIRALWTANPESHAAFLAEGKRRGGDEAVARLLARTIDLDDAAWKSAEGALPEDKKRLLRAEVRRSLEPGAPSDPLLGAVASVDLAEPAIQAGLAIRIRELAGQRPVPHPRAVGAMLRALARSRSEEAGRVGCDVLATADPALGGAAVDAALLAVAHTKARCTDAVLKLLKDERCHPSFRCGSGGARIDPRAASDQTEPLCTAADLGPDVAREIARPTAEILKDETRWTERWALAALAATDAIPPAWITAHERRRYAIAQPKSPPCGEGALGAPCHCDEATLRDQACRTDSSPVTVAFCRFEVDAKKKVIGGVTSASASASANQGQ